MTKKNQVDQNKCVPKASKVTVTPCDCLQVEICQKINHLNNHVKYPIIRKKEKVSQETTLGERRTPNYLSLINKQLLWLGEPCSHAEAVVYSKRLPSGLIYYGPRLDLPDEPHSNRYHVFSYDQVKRLNSVLQSTVTVSPRPPDWECVLFQHSLTSVLMEPCGTCKALREADSRLLSNNCYYCSCYCECCTSTQKSKVPKIKLSARPSTKTIDQQQKRICMPILYIKLHQLIRTLRDRLTEEQVTVREIRLNGGAAGSVIEGIEESKYSDLDLIFSVDLSVPNTFAKIKSVVFSTIAQFVADTFASGHVIYNCTPQHCAQCLYSGQFEQPTKQPTDPLNDKTRSASESDKTSDRPFNGSKLDALTNTTCIHCLAEMHCGPRAWCSVLRDESSVKNYIQKMVRIHKPSSKTADSWSLFTLGYRTTEGGKTVDIKFVDRMQRQFEFTVDSFQIVLDSLLTFHETCRQPLNPNYYPVVVAESVCGSFQQALNHLHDRLIVTPRPEEIRGGGLLKYCKLLVDGFRPSRDTDVLAMERYMCSRFFIDFPDIMSQHHRLSYFLNNHFEDNDTLKAAYLQILHEVVSHSTVCLMSHERQQTLCLIRMFLQGVISREETEQTLMTLQDFFAENWSLDSVVYGNILFPNGNLVKYLQNTASPSTSTSYPQIGKLDEKSGTSPRIENGNLSHQDTRVNGTIGPTGLENQGPAPPEIVQHSTALFDSESDQNLSCTNTDNGLNDRKTTGTKDSFTVSTDLTSSHFETDAKIKDKHETKSTNQTLTGALTDHYSNKLYYFPQLVTYLPVSTSPPSTQYTVAIQDGISNSSTIDSQPKANTLDKVSTVCHSRLVLSHIDPTTSSVPLDQYVNYSCSDAQYVYPATYELPSLATVVATPSPALYLYGQNATSNSVFQDTPNVLLAYPM